MNTSETRHILQRTDPNRKKDKTNLSWDTSRNHNDLNAVKGLVELVCRVTIYFQKFVELTIVKCAVSNSVPHYERRHGLHQLQHLVRHGYHRD
jgi:hypothetical protein